MAKFCPKCQTNKNETEFYKSGNRLDGWCKNCRIIASRNRYAPKKQALKEAKESVYVNGLKRCKSCNQLKPTSDYYSNPSHWDKLSHICKICDKSIYNRDISKATKKWYVKNKQRRLKKDREWRRNNPDKSRAIWQRYKTRKMKAEGDFTIEQWEAIKSYYCPDGLCLDCGERKKLTYDHIIPLCKGGSNYIENIQPLCGNCNSKKGRWHTFDFRPDKGEFARSLMTNA